jgi:hypothetical protein
MVASAAPSIPIGPVRVTEMGLECPVMHGGDGWPKRLDEYLFSRLSSADPSIEGESRVHIWRPRETTGDHGRPRETMGDHGRPREITSGAACSCTSTRCASLAPQPRRSRRRSARHRSSATRASACGWMRCQRQRPAAPLRAPGPPASASPPPATSADRGKTGGRRARPAPRLRWWVED